MRRSLYLWKTILYKNNKRHSKKKAKKDLRLCHVFNHLSQMIFFRVIGYDVAKKVWYKLKEKFLESNKAKAVKLLIVKREFEMLNMQESENIKTYVTSVMKTIGKYGLLEKIFLNLEC